MSPWCSPIVPVLKPTGEVRLCVDYRRLNLHTHQQHYYIPDLDDILRKVTDSNILSKLDLAQDFHRISVAEESRDYTTFVCQFGCFRFKRMPFGLKNAPAIFQRMELVLSPCADFCYCYIDDVVIFSRYWEEHMVHVRNVLQCLQETGIAAKSSQSMPLDLRTWFI